MIMCMISGEVLRKGSIFVISNSHVFGMKKPLRVSSCRTDVLFLSWISPSKPFPELLHCACLNHSTCNFIIIWFACLSSHKTVKDPRSWRPQSNVWWKINGHVWDSYSVFYNSQQVAKAAQLNHQKWSTEMSCLVSLRPPNRLISGPRTLESESQQGAGLSRAWMEGSKETS